MTMNKIEAEQLLELTEPYTKTDLKKAARRAIKKWHPDMAARNGVDLALASENYGKISDAEKHLAGFFDGHTDGYKVSPSTVDAGSPSSTQTTSSTTTTRTRRATTRNTTGATSSHATSTSKTDTSSSQSTPKEDAKKPKETRYWDAQEQQWKTDPTGKRAGWYDGGQESDQQRPGRAETTNAGNDEPKKAPKRPPRRPSATSQRATDEHKGTNHRNTRRQSNPRPSPSKTNGNAERQGQTSSGGAWEEQVVQEEARQPTVADYLRQISGERGKVRMFVIILAAVLCLISAESAFRSLSPDTQPAWFMALTFVTPLSFLLLALVEFGFRSISSGICSLLGSLSNGLENGTPFAKALIVVLKIVILLIKGLYKIVSWVIDYALGK